MVDNEAPLRRSRLVRDSVGDGAALRVQVVLAVGHDFVRSAVSALLAGSAAVELVGEASDAVGALGLLGHGRVDVLVLDRQLPDGASPGSIRRLRAEAPATSVLVVAMADDTSYASEAIGAGASGYVLKDTADAELVDAVVAAARGECYVSPRVAERLRAQGRADPRELGESDRAVLRLLARGYSEDAVGRELELSVAAVEACRAEIHRTLGLASRAELARYALRHGLLGRG